MKRGLLVVSAVLLSMMWGCEDGSDEAHTDGSSVGGAGPDDIVSDSPPANPSPDVDPAPDPSDVLARGAEAFENGMCFKCHGDDGTGGARAPDLTDGEWLHCDGSIEGIRSILESGVAKSDLIDETRPFAMNPATNLLTDPEDIDALAAYVASLSEG